MTIALILLSTLGALNVLIAFISLIGQSGHPGLTPDAATTEAAPVALTDYCEK